jgi:sugar phosphate isomerase/epimerase
LAPTLEPLLADVVGDVRAALDRLAGMGFRCVQLSATQPGLRPRELDRSARRDLLATLRRKELTLAGIDLWIPPGHLLEPARVDYALDAVQQAIELAADLERCPVSVNLPRAVESAAQTADEKEIVKSNPSTTNSPSAVIESIAACADRHGVAIADHAQPLQRFSGIGAGIDPATWLAAGLDPVKELFKLSDRLISARLCDLLTTGLRGPIGDRRHGRLDALAYRATLDTIGYRRPVVIDARQWSDPWNGIGQCASAW